MTEALVPLVILSVQEDDCAPRRESLAAFCAWCPEDIAVNARAAALEVGQSFQVDDGPEGPTWTVARIR